MGRCGATELRGVTAGTTSPATNRLAVWVTAATPMPVPVPAIVPVLVLVMIPVPSLMPVPARAIGRVLVLVPVRVLVLVMIPASVLARGCRGAFQAICRVTGDRDERSGGHLVAPVAFLSATQRV
jgi:hypothetical protein